MLVGVSIQKKKKLVWPFVENKYNHMLLKFAFQRASFEDVKKSDENYPNGQKSPKIAAPENSIAVDCTVVLEQIQ